jgi:uncharacterized protein YndB with AHSA1/START domain
MVEDIEISTVITASAKAIYEAWLDSDTHSSFTGSRSKVEPYVGGKHSAWDEYIQGETLELDPYRRILQSWITTEFPPGSEASLLEILLEEVEGGTRVTLIHTRIPEGQGEQYRDGWEENYFAPLREYFSSQVK